jgi:hypothetical protein
MRSYYLFIAQRRPGKSAPPKGHGWHQKGNRKMATKNTKRHKKEEMKDKNQYGE